jgi:hypothetical protein
MNCQIYSRQPIKRINENTFSLPQQAEFYLNLTNDTSGRVFAEIRFNGKFFKRVEINPHSKLKVINHLGQNQFFMISNCTNIIDIKWIREITYYFYDEQGKPSNNVYPDVAQTMLDYDRRINYGCVKNIPPNIFTNELNLGISSNRYKINKSYKYYESNQKIFLQEEPEKYPIENIKKYFKYYQPSLDIPHKQRINKLI